VTYRFFEDGEHDYFAEQYGLDGPSTEVIEVTSRGQRSVTLTNYAVAGEGRRIAHWHRVWVYLENRNRWRHTLWSRSQDSTQRGFRYTCEGRWQGNRFTCEAGPAPKPFRDDGAPFGFLRDDYAKIDRHDVILVTPEGWVQTSQNRKLDEDGELVSYETGWLLYERQPEDACTPAADDEERGDEDDRGEVVPCGREREGRDPAQADLDGGKTRPPDDAEGQEQDGVAEP